jgi:hypothetical protein
LDKDGFLLVCDTKNHWYRLLFFNPFLLIPSIICMAIDKHESVVYAGAYQEAGDKDGPLTEAR